MQRIRATWLASIVLLLALSGCGGSEEPKGDEPIESPSTSVSTTPSPTPTTTTPSPKPSPTKATSAAPPTQETPAAPSRPPASGDMDLNGAEIPQFNAVNGSVTCLFDKSEGIEVRCDVLGAKWPVERPAGCEEAFGDSVTMGDAPLLTCHGDTIFSPDTTRVLAKGKTAAFGDIVCKAATSSVSCTNGDDRGFTVSKADFSLR